jgi:plastocyanin
MARGNFVRSLLAASLIAASGVAAAFVPPPTPAGAAGNEQVVTVYETRFFPADLTVKVGDYVLFALDRRATPHHTITSDDNGNCPTKPGQPCWPEVRFDEGPACQTNLPRVRCFRMSVAGKFPYYDRYAREAGNDLMRGQIVVTEPPPTSSTTTTLPPTTTTTAAPTTSTTQASAIRPFVVSDPPPTPPTSAPATASPGPAAGSGQKPAGATPVPAAKDKDKSKEKGKAGSVEAPPTDTPTSPDAQALDTLFNSASLTPGPTTFPGAAAPDPVEAVQELDTSMLALLAPEKPDDGTGLMVVALGALGFTLLAVGVWRWLHRGSRYFPA